MNKILFSLVFGIMLILSNFRLAKAVKVELDEAKSGVSVSMTVSCRAGSEVDSDYFQGDLLQGSEEITSGVFYICGNDGCWADAYVLSRVITNFIEYYPWHNSQPFSHKFYYGFEWSSNGYGSSEGSSAGFMTTLDVTGMLYAKLVPTDKNENIGDEVILYFAPHVEPVGDHPFWDKNITIELAIDTLYLTIGEKTIGPYELNQHCYPCEVYTNLPPWIYPRYIGSTGGEDQWITAKVGDTIEFSYHIKADVHSVNPESLIEWCDDVSVGIELEVSKIPWIFVHGWDAGPKKWTVFKGFLEENIPIPPTEVDLRDPIDEDDWQNGEETYPDIRARRLAAEIDWLRWWVGFGKINLVCHSQGGLDARAYIRDLGEAAKDKIHSLVMIATPNHGTKAATIRNAWYNLTFRHWKSTPWLTPEWVEEFNRRTPLVDGVKYYTIAGSKFVFPGSCIIPGEDDGVVPVSSVHLDGATMLGPSPNENTFPYEHNELVEKKNVYDAIKNEIDPPYSEEPNSVAFIKIEDGEVLQNQSVSQSVTIDDINEVAFVLISDNPIDLNLQSPNGESITPQSTNPYVSYNSGEWLDLLTKSYVVQHPVPGVWNANVIGGTEPNHFMLLVSSENTFVLNGSTDKYSITLGENATVRAKLSTNATVRKMQAEIVGPYGLREIVPLYDDGIHEDDLPNDGLYGNVFYPSLEGEYILLFSAEGIEGDREFSRADLESIFVVASNLNSF